ncbi:IS3 family transposase [Acinetobacter sp. WCHAc060042]
MKFVHLFSTAQSTLTDMINCIIIYCRWQLKLKGLSPVQFRTQSCC